MQFGLDKATNTYDSQRADSDIRKLLTKPACSTLLQQALEHQKYLKLYVNGTDEFRKLVLDVAESRMTSQHFAVFKREFKPRTKSLCETIIRHFKNVFEAHGRVYNFNFNKDYEAEVAFNEIRKSLFNVSDEQYFEGYAHRAIFTEPNSIIVAGRDGEAYKSTRFTLDSIHDVKADESGIKYIIIKLESKNNEGAKQEMYYVYDELRRYAYLKSDSSFQFIEVIEHGANKCPVAFLSSQNISENDNICKASPLSTVVEDGKLQDLLINSMTMAYYKAASAFDTKVRPETVAKEDFKHDTDLSENLKDDARYPKFIKGKSRNAEMMGSVIEIPNAKMFNADFVGAVLNAVQNIPASTDVLRYHDEYLADLETRILSEVLGRGLGDSLRNQALNQDQVAANFEEQERALNMYSDNIANTWNYTLSRTAEMFAPDNFKSLMIKLGRKYFLKSEEQLLTELERMTATMSNSAQIMQKQFEIFLLKNRDNAKALERYQLITALQPFSYSSANWVMQNKELLSTDMINMYNHFNQVLSIFEYVNGKIELFGSEIENRERRLELLNTEFYNILNTKIILSDGNNIEAEPENRESN